MKISAIICSAGKGERAGFNKNKLMAPLNGAPALYYTLTDFDAFDWEYAGGNLQKIAVCAENDEETRKFCSSLGWQIVTGGKTRTESVYNALKAVTGDIVIIHDGARPFVTEEMIECCVRYVKEFGSAVCACPAIDTVAVAKDGNICEVPDRNNVYIVQTPQAFYTKDIVPAYEKAIASGESFTDDSSVYSRYVKPAKICPCGTPQNKKLTFKEDFENFCNYPTALFFDEEQPKVGFGVDVHAFGKEQDYITLCGVKIPCDTGLIAHSDGDVAVHAVMDALLSASGLRDIGHYFPDSDPKYSGADSIKLLKRVVEIIGEKGFKPLGLSVAVQAEKPRLAKYIGEMIATLARAVGVDEEDISITAGTCEGLGFVGQKKGICAYCTAVVKEVNTNG
ncbi:MAG: 2-C-methyl-D-erythritol 2,4-cyclodiphosphate synthase [Candidatus Coproplasma sp.]